MQRRCASGEAIERQLTMRSTGRSIRSLSSGDPDCERDIDCAARGQAVQSEQSDSNMRAFARDIYCAGAALTMSTSTRVPGLT